MEPLGARIGRWLARPIPRRTADRVARSPAIATALLTGRVYGRAAGGLLASGLAFSGLFALFSVSLFLIGILGFFVRDPVREAQVVAELGRRMPPLADVLEVGFRRVAQAAPSFSLAGLAGLGWSAGRLYDNLDIAFARLFDDEPQRSLAVRLFRGVLVVVGLTIVVVTVITLASIGVGIETVLRPSEAGTVRALATGLAAVSGLAVYAASVAAIYRLAPPRRPSWRAIRRPAIVASVLLSAFTSIFVQVQATLLGSLELFTEFVGFLATMVWLSIEFQILLVGAAWVRVREEGPTLGRETQPASADRSGTTGSAD